jgi:copper chaperone CopZ
MISDERFLSGKTRRRLSVNNITTILFLSLVIVAHAQASEPTVITLSCDGTVKTSVGNIEGPRKAINKLDTVVDLAEQTVSFAGFVAQIETIDGAVVFFGSGIDPAIGNIDQVTGVMSATTMKGNLATSYELFCKPVTRSASRKTK